MCDARPISPRLDTLTSSAICFLFVLVAFYANHKTWFQDMGAVWVAAEFFADAMPERMYDAPDQFFQGRMPEGWTEMAFDAGAPNETSELVPYVYPPLWAALLAPVTKITSAQVFFTVSQTLQVAALVAAMLLVRRMYNMGRGLTAHVAISCALLYYSVPSALALFQNQPQIMVTFLTVWAFERYGSGRSVQAGALLATAAAVKLVPAAFVLIFLFDRDGRAVLSFLLTLVGFSLLSVAVAGWDVHLLFLDRVQEFERHIIAVAHNHSLSVVWAQLADWNTVSNALPLKEPMLLLKQPAALGLALKLVFLGSVLALLFQTSKMASDKRLAVRLLGVGIMLGLTAPVGWAHYYLLPILLLPFLFGFLPRTEALIWIGVQLTVLSVNALFIAQSYPSASALSVIAPIAFWFGLFVRLCGYSLASSRSLLHDGAVSASRGPRRSR